MKHAKKHLDFELNLIPFIDLLSTCICFLLITAVWIQIGSMNVKQAVGGQPANETEKKPMMWAYVGQDGSISVDIQNTNQISDKIKKSKLEGKDGKLDLETISKFATELRTLEPNLRTVLIQPKQSTTYEDIVDLMDTVKKAGLTDLGVVPL